MHLLSTAYLPPVSYFKIVLFEPDLYLEQHENYVKQSYRNRCRIAGANGIQELSIPLIYSGNKTKIRDKKIAYKEKWQMVHWRSIQSAYAGAPYFEYFSENLKVFYDKKYEFLFDYNYHLLELLLSLLKQPKKINLTNEYLNQTGINDYRLKIHPKKEPVNSCADYFQVFKEKNGFLTDLSIIDLLFNEGLNTLKILKP